VGGVRFGARRGNPCLRTNRDGERFVTQASSIQDSTVVVPINKTPGAIGNLSPLIARDIHLWLEGVASPRSGQRAGDHTGAVSRTATFVNC
jgi:hypothetical protein